MYAALLKSLDRISVKKRRNHDSSVEKEHQQCESAAHDTSDIDTDQECTKRRLWLTEASLARLTEKILNNTESSLTSASKSNHFKIDASELDPR